MTTGQPLSASVARAVSGGGVSAPLRAGGVFDAVASERADAAAQCARRSTPRAGEATSEQAAAGGTTVVARLWWALKDVEDPEVPVSVVDMGLVVTVDYDPETRAAKLRITYTAMGCPAMDMIQGDIRARLLREPGVDRVDIEVVWDPVWTRKRLSESARETMRELGLAV